jgi:hypothetical protein
MNIAYIQIHDLSEIDLDDLYERCRDAIDSNWPESSTLTPEERKANMFALIESGINNEWPGLNVHAPGDTYIMLKIVDLDTETTMGFVSGYLIAGNGFNVEGKIIDGRHSFIAPDENGSRNYLYTEPSRIARQGFHDAIGATHSLYRNIPADSIQHRILRIRANAGTYELVEDADSPTLGPAFRNILIKYL